MHFNTLIYLYIHKQIEINDRSISRRFYIYLNRKQKPVSKSQKWAHLKPNLI